MIRIRFILIAHPDKLFSKASSMTQLAPQRPVGHSLPSDDRPNSQI